MNMYVIIIVVLSLIAPYTHAYKCLGEKHGECVSSSLCTSGVVVSGLCLPDTNQECCLEGSDAKCANIGGSCIHASKCLNSHSRFAELCPGTSAITCCLPENEDPPSQDTIDRMQQKKDITHDPTWKKLVENRVSIVADYILTNMTVPDAKKQSTRLCWPVARNSTQKQTVTDVSWGSYREHGKRCHAGVDIFTSTPGEVISIGHGQVINIIPHFTRCSRGWGLEKPNVAQDVSAVMVYYPDLGKTVNFGEMDPDKIRVRVGQIVNSGTVLGLATYCGMLHFEAYRGRAKTFHVWRPPKGVTLPPLGNICSVKYQNTANFRRTGLVDPRPLLKTLEGRFCGT